MKKFCEESGIETVEYARLLGYGLHESGLAEKQTDNWDKIKVKMKKQARLWNAHHPSICGKVMIAKTFLYSQMIFYGTIFLPSEKIKEELWEIIFNFMNNKKKMRKELYTSDPREGGLGLFEINNLLRSVQVNFVKKNIHNNDTWAKIIKQYNILGELGWIHNCMIDSDTFPIIHDLVKSINLVKNGFNGTNGNMYNSCILYNDLFRNDEGELLKKIFDDDGHDSMMQNLDRMTFKNLVTKSNEVLVPISKTRLEDLISYTLSNGEYKKFEKIIKLNIKKYASKYDLPRCSFEEFLRKKNNSSKNFRQILDGRKNFKVQHTNMYKYYRKSCEAEFGNLSSFKDYLGLWNLQCLDYKLAHFCYKFSHNLITTNDRLSHFSDENKGCTFCAKHHRPEPAESFLHAYYYCPVSTKYIDCFREYTGYEINASNFFIGENRRDISRERALYINIDCMILKLFLFTIRNNNRDGTSPPPIAALTYIRERKKTLIAGSLGLQRIENKMKQKFPYQGLRNCNFSMR